MQYDKADRLHRTFRGHLLNLSSGTLPSRLQAQGTYFSDMSTAEQQLRRQYTQDSVDNIEAFADKVNGTDASTVTSAYVQSGSNKDARNLILSRTGGSGNFTYDGGARMTFDPTTGNQYKYNYRGQVTRVTSSQQGVLAEYEYDCFGRMVHRIESPGAIGERSTIIVPNPGFGGDGDGADPAAEITYIFDGQDHVISEIVQFTYGLGAIGGGIGRKRVAELVAYIGETAPYYRFLHEDTQGNTIAVTSQWGDRLAEYDYDDYGTPLHAPIQLDGRWIDTLVAHSTHADVSVATLSSGTIAATGELIGCELRLVKESASSADDVYVCATVIGNKGNQVLLHDPGNTAASAWAGSAKQLNAFYDLRQGNVFGVMDNFSESVYGTGGNENGWGIYQPPSSSWMGTECTVIEASIGAFDSQWMYSQLPAQPLQNAHSTPLPAPQPNSYYGGESCPGGHVVHLPRKGPGYGSGYIELPPDNPLYIRVGPGPGGDFKQTVVLGVDYGSSVDQNGSFYSKLAIYGDELDNYVGPGKWFFIDGKADKDRAAQSGTWRKAATGSTFDIDTATGTQDPFKGALDHYPAVTKEMVGWTLQPDINVAAWAVITAVDPVDGTFTVSGDYAALAQPGKRWRIYAPPGTQRRDREAGDIASTGAMSLQPMKQLRPALAGRLLVGSGGAL